VGRLIGEKLDLEFACGGIECGVNFVGHLSNCNSMGKDGNRALDKWPLICYDISIIVVQLPAPTIHTTSARHTSSTTSEE
jgi:hypothetical protein